MRYLIISKERNIYSIITERDTLESIDLYMNDTDGVWDSLGQEWIIPCR